MNEKRFGRFEIGTYNGDSIVVKCDHANGNPRQYEIPFMTTTEARDLIYGLQQYLSMIEDERSQR